jgi:hypothetical protein
MEDKSKFGFEIITLNNKIKILIINQKKEVSKRRKIKLQFEIKILTISIHNIKDII